MSPGERNKQESRPKHLRKNAYLYIRQSTLHQVLENTESTRRQYEAAAACCSARLAEERIVVIDSGPRPIRRFSQRREGFQRLVARSARPRGHRSWAWRSPAWRRNSSDWHRLARDLCL